MHEDTTFEAPGVGGGISRRDMLRKSAVVGGAGALMWAAPSITKYGSAFGQDQDNGTPVGQGVSHIAVRYTCNGVEGWVKWDFNQEPYSLGTYDGAEGPFKVSEGAFDSCDCEGMENCPKDDAVDPSDPKYVGDASLFYVDVTEVKDGEVVGATVRFKDPYATSCTIDGNAWVKCGQNCTQLSGSTSVSVSDGDCPGPHDS